MFFRYDEITWIDIYFLSIMPFTAKPLYENADTPQIEINSIQISLDECQG